MTMRSDCMKCGVNRAAHRSLLYALGLTEEEINRPIIGIVNAFNEVIPGHTHLRQISEAVKAGVVAYVEGIRGFIPASQLSLSYVENLDEWVGRQVDVRVITVDEEKKRLVLSAKEVEKERKEEETNHKIAMLVPGTVTEGVVESLMPYGAFISLPDGLSGLVHISQISQRRIKKPSEVLKVGDHVKVKILNTNNNKISLSMKAVEENAEGGEEEKVSPVQYSSREEVTTSLGDLLKNLKL